MVIVKGLRAQKDANGAHSFIADVDLNGRLIQLPLTTREALDYAAFQEMIR